MVAGVLALAVVAAGVAFALNFFRSVANPAEAMPGNASALVTIQLNPNDATKLKAYRFLTAFPTLEERLTDQSEFTTDPRKAMWKALAQRRPDIDYDTDIRPWLGDSMSIGLVAPEGAGTSPSIVTAIHTIDAAKAKAFLEKESPDVTVEAIGDFVMMTDKANASLIAAARTSPLSSNTTYTEDMRHVGDGIVTVWADTAKLVKAMPTGSKMSADLAGRFSAALSIEPKAAELKAWSTANRSLPDADIRDMVGSLPASTDLVVSGALDKTALSGMYESLQVPMDRYAERLGLTLPADLATIFGDQTALVAETGTFEEAARTGDPSTAHVALVTTSRDTAAQQGVWDKAGAYGILPLTFIANGSRSAVGTSEAWVSSVLTPANKLRDIAEFKAAIDMDTPAQSIAYWRPDAIRTLAATKLGSTLSRNLDTISALGVSSKWVDSKSSIATVRLTLK